VAYAARTPEKEHLMKLMRIAVLVAVGAAVVALAGVGRPETAGGAAKPDPTHAKKDVTKSKAERAAASGDYSSLSARPG